MTNLCRHNIKTYLVLHVKRPIRLRDGPGFRREAAKNCALWVTAQRVVVISYRRFRTTYRSHPQALFGFLNPENGTDKLSRNVGKKLPLLSV